MDSIYEESAWKWWRFYFFASKGNYSGGDTLLLDQWIKKVISKNPSHKFSPGNGIVSSFI